MLPIREIDHIVLRCQDLEVMAAFYREVLGCPLEKAQPGLLQLRAGRSLLDLVPAPEGIHGRNLDHFCLRVQPFDAEAIARHLAAHRVTPEAVVQRFGADGEGPSMYLEDPEGNRVELKGP
jgi:catechol 2,3-dioxygenase-like lactoylglutathione lyase family enzyme